MRRDGSVGRVNLIPPSHRSFPEREKSRDELERWWPAQGQEGRTAGKRKPTKSELLLWQSVGAEWQDGEGKDETSCAMTEESVSGGVARAATVRIWHRYIFTRNCTPHFILIYCFCLVLLSLSSLFQPRLFSRPPFFSPNVITLLYANCNSLCLSLLCIPLSVLHPTY